MQVVVEFAYATIFWPATIALIIKVCLLVASWKHAKGAKLFYAMIISFALHDAYEAFGGVAIGASLFQVKLYYTFSTVALVVMSLYSLQGSKNNKPILTSPLGLAVVLAGTILAIFPFVTDRMVTGTEGLVFSATAIKGDLYPLYSLGFLSFNIFIMAVLINKYLEPESAEQQIKSIYKLVAFSPIFIGSFLVLLSLNMGWPINATIALPVATTIFIWIIFLTETNNKLSDLRRFVPYSKEREISGKMIEVCSEFARGTQSYRKSVEQVERELVMYLHQQNKGNMTLTAEAMEVPRTSAYGIFKRLEIDHTKPVESKKK